MSKTFDELLSIKFIEKIIEEENDKESIFDKIEGKFNDQSFQICKPCTQKTIPEHRLLSMQEVQGLLCDDCKKTMAESLSNHN